LALTLLVGVGLGIEAGYAQAAPAGWQFTSLPHADLWFHGMALVDPVGPGPNPLYDPAYPNEVRKAKESAGVGQTALDARLGYFRNAFRGDPAFEVLHFLPLYFAQAGRTEVFAALRLLAATAEGLPRAQSRNTGFGIAAVGSVLTTQSQRRVLGEFALALEREWESFFEAHWREGADRREQLRVSLQDAWVNDYGPALVPFLAGAGMSGGMAFLVPALGPEGRIFGGSPENPTDNVMALSAPKDPGNASEAVYSMLREFSFPLVRRAMDVAGGQAGNRNEEERVAAWAAIRSGALILEMFRPDDLIEYQKFFLSQAGRSTPVGEAPVGEATQGAFQEVYPLDADLEEALREEILSTARNGGVG
jgi:hypothetical protein